VGGLGNLAAVLLRDASDAELRSWAVGVTHAISVAGNFAQGALASSD
jgi:glucan phosphorylase